MPYLFILFVMLPMIAILTATIYTTARHYMFRRACYKRASLGSLVRGARKSAIVRHYGRGEV